MKRILDTYLLLESLNPLIIGNEGGRSNFRNWIRDKEDKRARGEISAWKTQIPLPPLWEVGGRDVIQENHRTCVICHTYHRTSVSHISWIRLPHEERTALKYLLMLVECWNEMRFQVVVKEWIQLWGNIKRIRWERTWYLLNTNYVLGHYTRQFSHVILLMWYI